MTPDEIRKGRELATRATMGPWESRGTPSRAPRYPGCSVTVSVNRWFIVDHGAPENNARDAAYIAHFHPARVLELLALAEEALRLREPFDVQCPRRECGCRFSVQPEDEEALRAKETAK